MELLERTLPAYKQTDKNNVVLEAKLAAVNTAFYDELEELRLGSPEDKAPVSVVRDITTLAGNTKPQEIPSAFDAALGEDLSGFDDIPLSEIARWRTDGKPHTAVFQRSVHELHRMLNARPGMYSREAIHEAVVHHIKAINACIAHSSNGKTRDLNLTGTRIQAIFPQSSILVQQSVSLGFGVLGAAVTSAAGYTGMEAVGVGSLFSMALAGVTLVFSSKTSADRWRKAECVLKDHIEDALSAATEHGAPVTSRQ